MTKTIVERCWNSGQSWHYTGTFKSVLSNGTTHTLRVRIERNAYDFQSSARVERWNGDKWCGVSYKPIAECNCFGLSYVEKGVEPSYFEPDVTALLDEALAIVG